MLKKDSDLIIAKFGANLRLLRIKRNMTQKKLADKAHLHFNYINDVELGKRNLSIKAIWKIAEALEITISELLSFNY